MNPILLLFAVLMGLACALPNRWPIEQTFFNGAKPHVVGGQDAKPNEFPWQLSLQYLHSSGEFRHTCGASLYKTKYALTAAHCVDGRQNLTFRVVAGLHQRSDETKATIAVVKTFKLHEQYNDQTSTYSNDIAVLTLATEIKPSATIKPAELPKDNKDKFVNKTCIISGWGRNSGANSLPDTLQKGEVQIISNDECENVGIGSIGSGHVCILDSERDTGACNGDSGGPINCKLTDGRDVVIGAASWVTSINNRCRPFFPSVYTRFSEYLDWINKNAPL